MIREIIALLKSFFNELVKIAKWPLNPTNGKGQYVTPSNRHFLTGTANFVVTICYRLSQAGVNFGKTLVFDVFAPLVDAIIGLASDLYHSNPNYTRMAVLGGISLLQSVIAIAFAGLMIVVGLFRE